MNLSLAAKQRRNNMKHAAAIAVMMCAFTVQAQSLQDQFIPKEPSGKDAS